MAAETQGAPFRLGWKGVLAALLVGILVGGSAMNLFSGRLFRNYLLANPEILPEAMKRLEEKEMARAISPRRAQLEAPFGSAWAGAKDGDVTLVQFFDYACSYCRRSNADVDRLLRDDPKLKVVWREWPVLGQGSEAAAQVSLAAAKQGRFKAFHDRLFALGRPSPATIAEAQRAIGLTQQQVDEAISSGAAQAELTANYQLARELGATGTPTFVVGDRILMGAESYDKLKAAIAEARDRG